MGLFSAIGSIAGALIGKESAEDSTNANAGFQREMAQNSLQWRVEDAKKAGIHPVAALGAQLPVGQPISAGGVDWSGVGQDVGGAIDAARTKNDPYTEKLRGLQIQRGELENALLASDLARKNQRPMNFSPSVVPETGDLAGQGNVAVQPTQLNDTTPAMPFKESGNVSEMTWARTAGGGVSIVPSKDWKDRGEDQTAPEFGWALRNTLMPSLGSYPKPPKEWLPKDATDWYFNPLIQEFRPVYGNRPTKKGRITNAFK